MPKTTCTRCSSDVMVWNTRKPVKQDQKTPDSTVQCWTHPCRLFHSYTLFYFTHRWISPNFAQPRHFCWIGRKLLNLNHENIFTRCGLPQQKYKNKSKKKKRKKCVHAVKKQDIQMAKSEVWSSSDPAAELSLKQKGLSKRQRAQQEKLPDNSRKASSTYSWSVGQYWKQRGERGSESARETEGG